MNDTYLEPEDRFASAAGPNLSPQATPPSRHTNPFATCWTRPGALPFRFLDGQSAEQLIARLIAQGWYGQIIGPHGSGKSTLLTTLIPKIERTGRQVASLALHNGKHPRLDSFLGGIDRASLGNTLIIIDGFEQLGWFQRRRAERFCRRWRAGLLITSHSTLGLPTLLNLDPDLNQILELATTLCGAVSASLNPRDVIASHARHRSNVREIFFDLYDRYEQVRRRSQSGI